MRLRCIKYEFDTDTISSANFYNDEVTHTPIAEVDLYDYLILDSFRDNVYKSPNISEQSQSYYFEANGVQFDVSGAKDGDYLLKDFFEITTQQIKYKWLLHQYNEEGQLIFSSIISKENITVSSIEDRVISIQSTAYELEFKEWFTNQRLFTLGGWNQPFRFSNGVPLFKFESKPLNTVLEEILHSSFLPDIILDNDIMAWQVTRHPYFYLDFPDFKDGMADILSGYDNFVHQQLSVFEFLNSLVKSMGWKWFFHLGKLYIKNLYSTQGEIIDIDYEKLGVGGVIETGIENTFLNLKIENVIIDNGHLRGGAGSTIKFPWGSPQQNFDLAGDRKVVFTKDGAHSNLMLTAEKYRLVGSTGSSGYGYATVTPPSSDMLRFKDDQFDMYRFDAIIIEQVNQEPRSFLQTYPQNKTLLLNVACNTERVTRIDEDNVRFISTSGDIYNGQFEISAGEPFGSDEDLEFCGNVGSMLYKFETSLNKFVTYQWYIGGSQRFVDNFSMYLGTDLLQLFRIKGDGIQWNPLNRYRIINYPTDIINLEEKVFSMQQLSFNQFDNTFELKVIVK